MSKTNDVLEQIVSLKLPHCKDVLEDLDRNFGDWFDWFDESVSPQFQLVTVSERFGFRSETGHKLLMIAKYIDLLEELRADDAAEQSLK